MPIYDAEEGAERKLVPLKPAVSVKDKGAQSRGAVGRCVLRKVTSANGHTSWGVSLKVKLSAFLTSSRRCSDFGQARFATRAAALLGTGVIITQFWFRPKTTRCVRAFSASQLSQACNGNVLDVGRFLRIHVGSYASASTAGADWIDVYKV